MEANAPGVDNLLAMLTELVQAGGVKNLIIGIETTDDRAAAIFNSHSQNDGEILELAEYVLDQLTEMVVSAEVTRH